MSVELYRYYFKLVRLEKQIEPEIDHGKTRRVRWKILWSCSDPHDGRQLVKSKKVAEAYGTVRIARPSGLGFLLVKALRFVEGA